jgi:hypothetical protein
LLVNVSRGIAGEALRPIPGAHSGNSSGDVSERLAAAAAEWAKRLQVEL